MGASGTGGGRGTEGLLFAGVPPVWPSVSSFMGPLLQSLKQTSSRRGNQGSEGTAAFPRPQAGRREPACFALCRALWVGPQPTAPGAPWVGQVLAGPAESRGPGLHWVWGLWKLLAGSACLSSSDPLWPRHCLSAELGDSCSPGGGSLAGPQPVPASGQGGPGTRWKRRGEGTGKRLDSWPGGGGHMKMWICRGGGGPRVRTPGKNPGAGGVGRLGRASRRPATGEGSGRNSRRAGWHRSQSTRGRQAQPPEQSAPPVLGWPSRCFLQPSLSLPAMAATVHRSPQGPARRGGPGAPRPVLGGSQAQRGRPEFGAGRRGLGGPGRTVAPRGHSLQLPPARGLQLILIPPRPCTTCSGSA